MEETAGRDAIVVGIGEYRIGCAPLATIGLGSCIALILHDEARSRGGMAHIMLPAANGRQDRPGKYVDSALQVLLAGLREQGCRNGSVVATLVGGATMFRDFCGALNIGERNIAAARLLLHEHRIRIQAEETGGTFGRSLVYYPQQNGKVCIRRADGACIDL